jgi:signal transduction histidine kinase
MTMPALVPPRDPLTFEQVRGDLSHEPASKLARIAGLLQQWRRGHVLPTDSADAQEILGDLEQLCLGHARLAAGDFDTLWSLLAVLGLIASLRRGFVVRRLGAAGSGADTLAVRLDALRLESQVLVERLSIRYASRFNDLVRAASEEVSREAGRRKDRGGRIDLDLPGETGGLWVPKGDAASWTDLLGNLVRNAIQASEDRGQPEPGVTAAVNVRLRPIPETGGAILEVTDEGVGMSSAMVGAMWREGVSTHGENRGQGLTEAKQEFLRARADLEVRSEPGRGTYIRVEVARRDIPLRAPKLWEMRTLQAGAAAVLVVASVAAWFLSKPDVASVALETTTLLRARNAIGRVLWEERLDATVQENYLGSALRPPHLRGVQPGPLVLSSTMPGGPGIIFATKPLVGPARVHKLDFRRRELWSHKVAWIEPSLSFIPPTEQLSCIFQAPVPWGADSAGAIALNVRKGSWSPTSIQFLSHDGDSLGAYYHPGHLELCCTMDFDGDGQFETLLNGINNQAVRDSSFLPVPAGDIYVECLLLLEPSRASGQAWPYRSWQGMPDAREKAYLLVPPLVAGEWPRIETVTPGDPAPPGKPRIQMVLKDGRIYQLDGRLRPLSCQVGDRTPAATLGLQRPMAPFLYIQDGIAERIDIPIGRE